MNERDIERLRIFFRESIEHDMGYLVHYVGKDGNVEKALMEGMELSSDPEMWKGFIQAQIREQAEEYDIFFCRMADVEDGKREELPDFCWITNINPKSLLGDECSDILNIWVPGTSFRIFYADIVQRGDKMGIIKLYDKRLHQEKAYLVNKVFQK